MFDHVELLNNYALAKGTTYLAWLKERTKVPVALERIELQSPMDYRAVYQAAKRRVEAVRNARPGDEVFFHLSPGTPVMQQVWVLLASSVFPARLVRTSKEEGFTETKLPFEIAVDFVPEKKLKKADEKLVELAQGSVPSSWGFGEITYRSEAMSRVIERARIVARRSVPVLVQGESGTGKELLARAIHSASLRANGPFIAVNCGAVPEHLVEAAFFGVRKGAFTGAHADAKGVLEEASGGTLFLDEIGEMPLAAQVKLLRSLQLGVVTRVGETAERKVDLRVIAATNRNLMDEVGSGRFREDLFHRLAVAILLMPPLRDREGEVSLLADKLLDRINTEATNEPGYQHKKLTASAKKLLSQQPWPGNVRELGNTLLRASLWSQGDTIGADEIREALLSTRARSGDQVKGRPLGAGLDLRGIIKEVAEHYLERAMAETHGNKTHAAELLGLGSYQTLTNWLEKYGVKDGSR
ncbi:MAG TPA: RNA repair transcriptional activator RtcR family protein [Thermoleophilia bacterium]|nr:RNA repair transcriptional activator RtcR family protein [Thermoleophilia bacterium]